MTKYTQLQSLYNLQHISFISLSWNVGKIHKLKRIFVLKKSAKRLVKQFWNTKELFKKDKFIQNL